ncbi:MAG: transcriptional regulator [Candidatus Thermoplasmatota archaeon]
MERLESAQEIKKILEQGNFSASEYCRSSVFDFVARKGELLLFIKLLSNIDAMRYEIAKELKTICKFLRGVPIAISKRSGSGEIKDGTVYLRHDVLTMSERTFEELAIENVKPQVYAMPGGFYARIDIEKMKRIRRTRKISLGEVARAIGVSRKAVQLYEQGMKPEIKTALKLENFMGETLIMPIDVSYYTREFEAISFEFNLEKLEFFKRAVFSRLSKLGYEVLPTFRSPFTGLTKNEREAFITCIDENEKLLAKKTRLIASISDVVKRISVFFVKKSEKKNFSGIPVIAWEDLKETTSSEEVTEIILERTKK